MLHACLQTRYLFFSAPVSHFIVRVTGIAKLSLSYSLQLHRLITGESKKQKGESPMLYVQNRSIQQALGICGISMLCLALSPAHAGPTFRASAGFISIGSQITEPEPGSAAFLGFGVNGQSGADEAIATAGQLGGFGTGTIPLTTGADAPPLGGAFTLTGGGVGYMRIDDLIIINTENPASTSPASVSTNFHLDGSFSFSQNPSDNSQARVSVLVQYGIGYFPNFRTPSSLGAITRGRDRGSDLASNSGIFASAGLGTSTSINQTFVTPEVEVDVDEPIPLVFSISASIAVVSRDGGGVSGTSDFLNTLAFPSTGPVFNLPNGYTASSVQAGIVDNQWIAATATPAPAAWTLMWLGAGALIAFGYRHHR